VRPRPSVAQPNWRYGPGGHIYGSDGRRLYGLGENPGGIK